MKEIKDIESIAIYITALLLTFVIYNNWIQFIIVAKEEPILTMAVILGIFLVVYFSFKYVYRKIKK